MFKARYFPHGDFLSAELGHHPSYAWRSIFLAQSVVHNGHRWQVGNGESIRVWHDRWLPNPSTFKLTSPPVGLPFDAWVSSLIDPSDKCWHINMVRQTFSSNDATSILGIPLSARLSADRLVWAYSTKENFTVRSAYNVALSSTFGSVPGPFNGKNSGTFWKSLWGLNVPNNIKNFAWHASRNILPTKANLCHRKVLDNPTCKAYGMEAKSNGHLFLEM